MGLLDGRVALVTGAARGQGEAEARLLAAEGATVYAGDVLAGQVEAVAASIRAGGGDATGLRLDVTDDASWEAVLAAVERRHGVLHVLVHNAGILERERIVGGGLESWRRTLAVNLEGMFLGTRRAIPLLRRAGGASVVMVASVASLVAGPYAGYTASKWAVRGLAFEAAFELAADGIRVNAVHPGLVDTAMTAGFPTEALARLPFGRGSRPDEIAAVVLWLASDASALVSGSDIAVDGARSAGLPG